VGEDGGGGEAEGGDGTGGREGDPWGRRARHGRVPLPMPGNPKESKWRSTPDAARKRPHFRGTVPRELLERVRERAAELDALDGRGGEEPPARRGLTDSAILERALELWLEATDPAREQSGCGRSVRPRVSRQGAPAAA